MRIIRRWSPAFVALVILSASCGLRSAEDVEVDADVLALFEVLTEPAATTPDLVAAADAAAAAGDPRFVPYLLDLLRVEFDPQRVAPIASALSTLTGVNAAGDQVSDHVAFGTWILDRRDLIPPETYPAWKGQVYARLSPEFERLINHLDPRMAAETQWGGVPYNGIAPIDVPALVGVAGAGYLAPTDLVFGAVIDDVARAYPLRILDVHEMSNDILNGWPVVLANCTLCRSGTLYSRLVDGRELEFVTSGLLLDSNKLMVDLQTHSIWQQLTGTAIAGPLAGSELEQFFLTTTTWAAWSEQHPDTLVLALPEPAGPALAIGAASYEEGAAYREYYQADELWFPAPSTTGGAPKVDVVGVTHNERSLAIEIGALAQHGILSTQVGGDEITVVPTEAAGARVYLGAIGDAAVVAETESHLELDDGRTLPRMQTTPAFWFAWSSVHPDSERWP